MRLPVTNSEIAEILEACKQHLTGHVNQVYGAASLSNYICNAVKHVCEWHGAEQGVIAAARFTISKALSPSPVLIGKYWDMLDTCGTGVDDPDYRIFRDLWLDALIAELLASPDEVHDATGWIA